MNQKIRYPLLLGLVLALFEFFIFVIRDFATMMANLNFITVGIFMISFSAVVFIIRAFKCYKLPTSLFQKERKYVWIACILIVIYWFYLAIILGTNHYDNFIFTIGHIIILTGCILLIMLGNGMRINDKGLEYCEKNDKNTLNAKK